MAKYQLGRSISDEDVAKIEAFLKSLSGEYQGVPVGNL
jgi:cytochrome c peroxidase